jgi:translation initiation factor 2 subunit 3
MNTTEIKLDNDSEVLLIEEIMHNQPTLNIGMIGSVSDGKSTLVSELSSEDTMRNSKEKKSSKTIYLGYANAKIFKCSKCIEPICYQSYPSEVYDPKCKHCSKIMDLVKHVSFVDVPGHNSLMATMLNGVYVMDSTIIVEACNNKNIPAPQTEEHLIAAKFMNLHNDIVCMNKLDLVKPEKAMKKINNFIQYLNENDTVAKGSKMVPISANHGLNVDVVCEYISKLSDPVRDFERETKMIVVRSFKNNKPDTQIKDMKGGVVGGSIVTGVLRVGDMVEILPGLIRKQSKGWTYAPLKSTVLSIQSGKNNLKYAIPGGLVGVQLTLDPGLTTKDGLVSNIIRVLRKDKEPIKYNVFETLRVELEMVRKDGYKMKVGDKLVVSYNAKNVDCTVSIKRKKKAELVLNSPICAELGDSVVISRKVGTTIKLVCRGIVREGDMAELLSF